MHMTYSLAASRTFDWRPQPTLVHDDSPGADLLEGAEAIAKFLFGTERHRRRVYYLVETGRLPTFRIGKLIYARKSALTAMIQGAR
jgi:hypothetical protein